MKQTLTKAEWKQVEERLNGMYRPVALVCDGYHLILNLVRSGNRLIIGFYVNGVMRGVWMRDDCEERSRFFRPHERSAWKAESRARLKKMSKRTLKMMKVDPDETFTVHYPYWTSVQTLRRHLEKHNDSIELLKDWEYKGQEPATKEEETP